VLAKQLDDSANQTVLEILEWSSVNQRCAYMFVSFVDFGVSFVDCVFQSKYLLMRFSYVFLQTCDFGKFVFSEFFLR